MSLTFSNLRHANVRRCANVFHPLLSWSPTDWATAFGGEAGELLNKIKKLRRGDQVSLDSIADEMADAIIYLDLLAARLEINLEEAVRRKFNEVSARRMSDYKL